MNESRKTIITAIIISVITLIGACIAIILNILATVGVFDDLNPPPKITLVLFAFVFTGVAILAITNLYRYIINFPDK